MSAKQADILSDRQLVTGVLNGDRQSATMLMRSTERLVSQIVYKMLGNHPDRKDLVQDVYMKTFRNLPRFRFQCKLSTWVAQISYNTCLDHLKKIRPDLTDIPADDDLFQGNHSPPDMSSGGLDASQLLSIKQRAEILDRLCAELPPVYATLITLFHKEELSLEEITDITGLPVGTIKSYLFRARKILKDKLLNQYSKEDL